MIIDNPGGGDCLFYAISTGLIHSIQTNPDRTQARSLWDRWVHLGGLRQIQPPISFDTILKLNLTSNPKDNSDIKIVLQQSLRNIAAKAINQQAEDLWLESIQGSDEKLIKQIKLDHLNKELKNYDEIDLKVSKLEKPVKDLVVQYTNIRAQNGYKDNDQSRILAAQIKSLSDEIKKNNPLIYQQYKKLQDDPRISELRHERSDLGKSNLENHTVYRSMRELVKFYKETPNGKKDLHNIYYPSKEVNDLAIKIAKTCNSEEEINQAITQPDTMTKLFAGVNTISNAKSHEFGNYEHAGAILTALKVNSSIQKQGELVPNVDTTFGNSTPVIKLVNVQDRHWVTELELPQANLNKAQNVEPQKVQEVKQTIPVQKTQETNPLETKIEKLKGAVIMAVMENHHNLAKSHLDTINKLEQQSENNLGYGPPNNVVQGMFNPAKASTHEEKVERLKDSIVTLVSSNNFYLAHKQIQALQRIEGIKKTSDFKLELQSYKKDPATHYSQILQRVREKEHAGEGLTESQKKQVGVSLNDEELAAKLQEEEFRNPSMKP